MGWRERGMQCKVWWEEMTVKGIIVNTQAKKPVHLSTH